jgi:hypothetical protein
MSDISFILNTTTQQMLVYIAVFFFSGQKQHMFSTTHHIMLLPNDFFTVTCNEGSKMFLFGYFRKMQKINTALHKLKGKLHNRCKTTL